MKISKKKLVSAIKVFFITLIVSAIIAVILSFTIIGVQSTIKTYNDSKKEVTMKLKNPVVVNIDLRRDLLSVLKTYNVKDPEIVYCMAYLETGGFNSRLCLENNNILGLYDSKNDGFMKFYDLSDCIKAYKKYVEYKRLDNETMFEFIERIGYAKDPEYINKVKIILNQKFPNYEY